MTLYRFWSQGMDNDRIPQNTKAIIIYLYPKPYQTLVYKLNNFSKKKGLQTVKTIENPKYISYVCLLLGQHNHHNITFRNAFSTFLQNLTESKPPTVLGKVI